MVTLATRDHLIIATTIEDLISDPALDTLSPDTWDDILAELDMAQAASETGTFALVQQAGMIDVHLSPWEVE